MGRMSTDKEFQFHPKCVRIKLSHLMFANDVIIFSKATQSSLVKIKEVLDVFHRWSGLSVNSNNSAIFFGGVNEGDCNILATIMGFGRGKFPFTYLGIPMDSKALRSYLWAGLSSSKKSLVAGNLVCMHKDHGGLGVKNVLIFNKVFLLGQVWDLCLKKDALWIKWMDKYYFKNQSFWEVLERNHHTWGLKKLLRLRSSALQCVQMDAQHNMIWRDGTTPFTVKGI